MHAADTVATTAALAWWIWPLALFAATFLLGIIAVLSGVGGGVLLSIVAAAYLRMLPLLARRARVYALIAALELAVLLAAASGLLNSISGG